MTANPTRPRYIVLAGAILACGAMAFYVCFRLSFFTIAAPHVLDIPELSARWLPRFFWVSLLVPLVWLLSAGAAVFEMKTGMRYRRIAVYLTAPLVPAAIQFIAWQFYLASLR